MCSRRCATQELGGGATELGDVLRDHADGRLEQVGELEVVEADRRRWTCEPECTKRMERREVIRFCPVKSAVGGSGSANSSRTAASVLAGFATFARSSAGSSAMPSAERHRGSPAAAPARCRARPFGEEPDATMAARRHAVDRPAVPRHCRTARCPHRGMRAGGGRRRARARVALACEVAVILARRDDDQAVDAPRAEREASSRSSSGCSSALAAKVRTPRARATLDRAVNVREEGFATSSKTRPMLEDTRSGGQRPAESSRRYPITRSPRARAGEVASTVRSPLTARETVFRLTSASAATSRIVGVVLGGWARRGTTFTQRCVTLERTTRGRCVS